MVRKFTAWKKIYCSKREENKSSKSDHDITSDDISLDETEGLESMMIPKFYDECFKRHFIEENQIVKTNSKGQINQK